MRNTRLLLTVIFILISCMADAQDTTSVYGKITGFPGKFFKKISGKADDINKQLDKQTAKYLARLSKQEAKLRGRITKTDSNASKTVFSGNTQQQYAQWLQKMKADSVAGKGKNIAGGEYYPYVDSLQTSMAFLKKNPQLLDPSKVGPGDLQNSMNKLSLLQSKMQDAGMIQQFAQQRREQLKQYLSNYTHIPPGIMNAYNGYNKQLYYYKQQVDEYKEMLNDPDKMMKTALGLLNKVPAFTSFMQKNSVLASLFNLPGAYNPSTLNQGMATRDQVVAAFQNQLGPGGPNLSSVVQQNMQSGQGQASQLTDKLSGLGKSGGSDLDMPNFSPNSQKTKSFLKRLQFGVNLQTAQSTYFFPTTSDLGLSIGFKINDNNTIGLGASYKIGWGQDISHVKVTGQGLSLRSFMDMKIKRSWFASGGFEYNYQQPFDAVDVPALKNWQQSGLIGISKIVSLKTKVFKSTKLQLLWDFLSYQQIPKAQPFKFRVGYNF